MGTLLCCDTDIVDYQSSVYCLAGVLVDIDSHNIMIIFLEALTLASSLLIFPVSLAYGFTTGTSWKLDHPGLSDALQNSLVCSAAWRNIPGPVKYPSGLY